MVISPRPRRCAVWLPSSRMRICVGPDSAISPSAGPTMMTSGMAASFRVGRGGQVAGGSAAGGSVGGGGSGGELGDELEQFRGRLELREVAGLGDELEPGA